MKNSFKTAVVTAAALALMATPALAYDGTDNPGTTYRENATQNAPHSGDDNPGTERRLSRAEARALGKKQCQEFKTNFSENRSAFGKCIAAAAKALRSNGDVSPGQACKGQNRKRQEGQKRSDFNACVVAAARALKEQKAQNEDNQATGQTA